MEARDYPPASKCSNGNVGFDIGLAAIESGSISLSSAAMRLEVIARALPTAAQHMCARSRYWVHRGSGVHSSSTPMSPNR